MEEELEKLDTEMKEKISELKKEYSEKKKELKKKFKKEKPAKETRPSIPKSLKNQVWNTYVGKEKGVGNCLCCNTEIDSKKFDCGHIESDNTGGETILENLRPICSTCNKSMGNQNLFEFKEKYFPKKEEEKKPEVSMFHGSMMGGLNNSMGGARFGFEDNDQQSRWFG